MIRKLIVALTLFIASLGAIGFVPSTAGAVTVDCPVAWFESNASVYHCTRDGNHFVMDRYQGPNYWQGVVNTWVPGNTVFFVTPGQLGGNTAWANVCPDFSGASSISMPAASGNAYSVKRGSVWSLEGVYSNTNWVNWQYVSCNGVGNSGTRQALV